LTFNQGVAGSNPAGLTNEIIGFKKKPCGAVTPARVFARSPVGRLE
jgi:hypothetical protein